MFYEARKVVVLTKSKHNSPESETTESASKKQLQKDEAL